MHRTLGLTGLAKRLFLSLLPRWGSAWLWLISVHSVYAAERFPDPKMLVEDGLSHKTVHQSLRDSRGYMWFGTMNGLNQSDGYRIRVYEHNPEDRNSISSNLITVLYEDNQEHLWVGTSKGLNRFNRGKRQFSRFPINPPRDSVPLSEGISAITQAPDNQLWVITNWSVSLLDPETGRYETLSPLALLPEMKADQIILSVWGSREWKLWLLTAQDLLVLDWPTRTLTAHGLTGKLPGLEQRPRLNRNLYRDFQGRFWIGSDRGLVKFDPGSERIELMPPQPELPSSREYQGVLAFSPDPRGNLWVVTPSTLTYFRTDQGRFAPQPPLGTPPFSKAMAGTITHIYDDGHGLLWLANDAVGILKHPTQGRPFRSFSAPSTEPPDIQDARVYAFLEHRSGHIWVGSEQGLHLFNPKTASFIEPKAFGGSVPAWAQGRVWAMIRDRTDQVWAATRQGLVRWEEDTGRARHYPAASNGVQGPVSDAVRSLFEDRSGVLWVGTHGQGLSRRLPDGGGFFHHIPDPRDPFSLSNGFVNCFFQDRTGAVWIGTSHGLNLWHEDTQRFSRFPSESTGPVALSHEMITALYEQPGQGLWIGTYGGGLNLYSEDRELKVFKLDGGVAGNNVVGILEDRRGLLWLSTNRGLVRFNPQSEAMTHFSPHDGLQDYPFLCGAHFSSSDATFFFGGLRGFSMFKPEQVPPRELPGKVQFTDFLVYHREGEVAVGGNSPHGLFSHPEAVEERDVLALTHRQRQFSIEFAALNHRNPEAVRYAYKMEGFHPYWIETDASSRMVTFANLDAGTYKFRVRAALKGNAWSREEAQLTINIHPPLWFSPGAIAVYIAIALLAAAVYHRGHRNRQAKEENLVREETGLWRQKHRELQHAYHQLAQQAEGLEHQTAKLKDQDQWKTKFFINLSHELRTPLTLIVAPLEELRKGTTPQDTRENYHQSMWRNAHRLLNTLNHLLDLAKLNAGAMGFCPRPGDLTLLLSQWLETFRPLASQKGLDLVLEIPEEPVFFSFDADYLEKVVANLVANAIKHAPAGSPVKIRLAQESSREAALSVCDQGPGIPPEHLPRVFRRFFQVPQSQGQKSFSSGLGLSLAKELVEAHSGRIEVNSKRGEGTRFTVHLPLSQSSTPQASSQPTTDGAYGEQLCRELTPVTENGANSSGSSRECHQDEPAKATLLLIENDRELSGLIGTSLGEQYRIFTQTEFAGAKDLVMKERPDLILGDLMLPGQDGLALCQFIKQDPQLGHTPIVVLTAKADLESKVAAFEHWADDVLVKPFSLEELRLRIRNHLAARTKIREYCRRESVLRPEKDHVPSANMAFLESVRKHFQQHLADDRFGVLELADSLGLSRRQFHRKMVALAGKTPRQFMRDYRLERAADLLRKKSGNISQIAYAVGFRDPAYFTKQFRKQFGTSPRNFGRMS